MYNKIMWSSHERSETQLGRDKRDILTFDTVLYPSNLSSLRRKYSGDIPTEKIVLSCSPKISKRPLKIFYWWPRNKEREIYIGSSRRDFWQPLIAPEARGELWRPVLVKTAIIKLLHRSVFAATVVLFISLLCIFIGGTVFFFFFFLRTLLITFSNVNYFNVSLVKFFIGSTNEFSHSYCNLFLNVLRIICYFWYPELFFHWR